MTVPIEIATPDSPIEITVLITANNEAENIQGCLRAIAVQDYPMERVEVLLVDDRSTDDTSELARRVELPCALRIERIDEAPTHLTARQHAIDVGIRAAQGEIVLLADAAGRAPREWVREMAGHVSFRDGVVAAPVLFSGRNRMLAGLQSLDALLKFNLYSWIYRHRQGAGLFSGNVAMRREAYIETGGFETIGYALDEDRALGEALTRAGWSIRYLTRPATVNNAVQSLDELWSRWRRKVQHGLPLLKLWMIAMTLINLALIAAAFMGGMQWTMILLTRYLIGAGFISMSIDKYGSYNLAAWILLYEPVMTFLIPAIFVSNVVRPRWEWRGVNYMRRGPAESPAAQQSPT